MLILFWRLQRSAVSNVGWTNNISFTAIFSVRHQNYCSWLIYASCHIEYANLLARNPLNNRECNSMSQPIPILWNTCILNPILVMFSLAERLFLFYILMSTCKLACGMLKMVWICEYRHRFTNNATYIKERPFGKRYFSFVAWSLLIV